MNEDLPGYEEAYKLGYSLYAHSGDKKQALYSKGKLCLTVHEKGTADISSHYKFIRMVTGNFSFPHKNFHIFENQILHVLKGIGE